MFKQNKYTFFNVSLERFNYRGWTFVYVFFLHIASFRSPRNWLSILDLLIFWNGATTHALIRSLSLSLSLSFGSAPSIDRSIVVHSSPLSNCCPPFMMFPFRFSKNNNSHHLGVHVYLPLICVHGRPELQHAWRPDMVSVKRVFFGDEFTQRFGSALWLHVESNIKMDWSWNYEHSEKANKRQKRERECECVTL